MMRLVYLTKLMTNHVWTLQIQTKVIHYRNEFHKTKTLSSWDIFFIKHIEEFKNLLQKFQSAVESFEESSKFQKTVNLATELHKFVGQKIDKVDVQLPVSKKVTPIQAKDIQKMVNFMNDMFEPYGTGYELSIMEILYGLGECMRNERQFQIALQCYGK